MEKYIINVTIAILILTILIVIKWYMQRRRVNKEIKSSTVELEVSKPCIEELKKVANLIVKDDKLRSRKLKIFEILANTSKEFLGSLDPNSGKVERMLTAITKELNFDRGYMFKIRKSDNTFELKYSYGDFGRDKCSILNCDLHRDLYQKLTDGINILNITDLALISRNVFNHAESLILIPIFVGNKFTGFMGFDASRDKIWDEIEVDSLKIVGEIFGAWCDRRKANTILEEENKLLKTS